MSAHSAARGAKTRLSDKRRRRLISGLSAIVGLTMIVPTAWADEISDIDDELARVRSTLAATASTVAEVEVAIVDQRNRLDEITVDAMVAREDHVDAVIELDKREGEAQVAQAQAAEAADKAEEARKNLARVALQAGRSGTSLTQLEAFVTADGFENVVARSEAYDLVGSRISDAEQDLRAARLIADTLAERADRAVVAAADAAQDAQFALETYEAAEELAETALIESEKVYEDLLIRMANLRGTTVDLERERQEKREQERIRRAEEEIMNWPGPDETTGGSASQPQTPPAETTPVDNPSPAPTPSPTQSASPSPTPTSTPSPTPTPTPTPTPKPDPKPTPPPGGSSSGSAAKGKGALSWARDQIGKPYLYGAAGPNSFDCSGLTMRAWQHGGSLSIMRTSRDQYRTSKKIAYNELRPGDLVFWGTNPNDWSSVYHVAMYAGNNKVVEAPSSGKHVREISLAERTTSNLMPYAGRP
ncbi:MAG TPA: C40 family peptidase [Actinomycetales bacterium]|nr:C40 family peptidase [Actinomycetales bacterium]